MNEQLSPETIEKLTAQVAKSPKGTPKLELPNGKEQTILVSRAEDVEITRSPKTLLAVKLSITELDGEATCLSFTTHKLGLLRLMTPYLAELAGKRWLIGRTGQGQKTSWTFAPVTIENHNDS